VKPEIIGKLLALNRQFYEAYAEDFSQSRQGINPGFNQLLSELPRPCPRLLDVGCGNGRFGQFLQQHQAVNEYVGVDFSLGLLGIAPGLAMGEFYGRDLSQPGCLDGLGEFDGVVCLAVLHHIPGRANRLRLLQEMKAHLAAHSCASHSCAPHSCAPHSCAPHSCAPECRLILSTWQFATNERQQRKIRDWAEVGLSPDDVEPGDCLLTWQRGGLAYRYACLIDEMETAVLAAEAGLTILHQFRSDGREGDLSLYSVFGNR
jgi:SAM-dependent methyltransferase